MTLTELRESKGLSVREVARRMGQTHPNIIRFERDGSAPGKTMDAYAKAIGVNGAAVYRACCAVREKTSTDSHL